MPTSKPGSPSATTATLTPRRAKLLPSALPPLRVCAPRRRESCSTSCCACASGAASTRSGRRWRSTSAVTWSIPPCGGAGWTYSTTPSPPSTCWRFSTGASSSGPSCSSRASCRPSLNRPPPQRGQRPTISPCCAPISRSAPRPNSPRSGSVRRGRTPSCLCRSWSACSKPVADPCSAPMSAHTPAPCGASSVPSIPPSSVTPSLLRHSALLETLDKLRFALSRDTIALLVAESGCGKSTTLALFAKSLDAGSYHVLATSLTTVGPFGLISHLAALSGLRPCRFKGDTAATFIAHLRGLPKRTVLLVDEAHMMPDASLEDLRLLTACDFDRRSPFALFLVRHLKAAGAKKNLFEPDAIAALFQHTRGVPRLVQNVALAAMLVSMETEKKIVDVAAVQQAVADLEAA